MNKKGRNHPNIYRFIEIIKKEQTFTELNISLLLAGHPPTQRKKKYIEADRKLEKLKTKLIRNEITLRQYLDDASQFVCLKKKK